MFLRWLPFFVVVLLPSAALAVEPVAAPEALPRVPPTEPDRAAATFRIRPGFTAQLVAAEPQVMSPVALAFDEHRRAYVIEMRDYSERRPERLGRVRLLQDSHGDGRLDSATVFLDNLPWPTAVTCWDGGVFVGATPDIYFARDTDGDGRADVREVVFIGFAEDYAPYATNKLNVQALMNSLQWGLDQRIHGAASLSAGTMRLVDTPFTRAWRRAAGLTNWPAPVSLRGRDFSFDPRTLDFRAETGGGQHGMSFDDDGRKYVCSNSDHLQQVLYDDTLLPSNPQHAAPSSRASIAADGPAATVFRVSPDEPWRVLRTRWRVAGLVPGPVEGGGRPSGYFTGATGVTIYRGDAYGADYQGDAFIADCGSNLVHRKKLRIGPDGIVRVGERDPSERDREFLASTDNWFRPVQFVNAPDGCLWVIDMYRETIEHPWSLPEGLKRHLDLDSGQDRGRLWRLAPGGFKAAGTLTVATGIRPPDSREWVAQLESPNGWVRDTAARQLHQTRDPGAVKLLKALLTRSGPPVGRMHALHVLHGVGALDAEMLGRAATDPSAEVRAQAVLLAGDVGFPKPALWVQLANDRDAQVRFTVGQRAANVPSAERAMVLAALLGHGPELVRGLALHAANGFELALWDQLAGDSTKSGEALPGLARLIGGKRRDLLVDESLAPAIRRKFAPDPVIHVAESAAQLRPMTVRFSVATALLEGAAAGDGGTAAAIGKVLQPVLAEARDRVTAKLAGSDDTVLRLTAVPLLAHLPAAEAVPVLSVVLADGTDAERQAALRSLARFQGREWAEVLVARVTGSGTLKPQLFSLLLRRPEGHAALVAALERGAVRPADLTTESIQSLRQAADPDVRKNARRLLGEPPADRRAVIEARLGVLNRAGDGKRGAAVFTERCAGCHKFHGVGQELGPDLASVVSNGPEKMLVSILDPNREVAPNFTAWLAETDGGESVSGVLVREADGNVTLRQAGGITVTLPRARLRRLENTGRSLMPEGIEEGLDDPHFADLLAYLTGQ